MNEKTGTSNAVLPAAAPRALTKSSSDKSVDGQVRDTAVAIPRILLDTPVGGGGGGGRSKQEERNEYLQARRSCPNLYWVYSYKMYCISGRKSGEIADSENK